MTSPIAPTLSRRLLWAALLLSTLALTGPASAQTMLATFDDGSFAGGIGYGDDAADGFGPLTNLGSAGGGVYGAGGTFGTGQALGLFSGSGNAQVGRSLDTTLPAGVVFADLLFNLSNSAGFSGLNLKTSLGGGFGSGELLSVGLAPGNDQGLLVTGSSGSQTVALGTELRGNRLTVRIEFDTSLGTALVAVDLDDDFATFTPDQTLSGITIATGTPVGALGFANFNTGGSQDLIVDNVSAVPEPLTAGLILALAALGLRAVRRPARPAQR